MQKHRGLDVRDAPGILLHGPGGTLQPALEFLRLEIGEVQRVLQRPHPVGVELPGVPVIHHPPRVSLQLQQIQATGHRDQQVALVDPAGVRGELEAPTPGTARPPASAGARGPSPPAPTGSRNGAAGTSVRAAREGPASERADAGLTSPGNLLRLDGRVNPPPEGPSIRPYTSAARAVTDPGNAKIPPDQPDRTGSCELLLSQLRNSCCGGPFTGGPELRVRRRQTQPSHAPEDPFPLKCMAHINERGIHHLQLRRDIQHAG